MDDIQKKLEKTILQNQPVLFLGAGFTVGATLNNGIPAPKGDELKQILLKELLRLDPVSREYQELSQSDLKRVCSYIQDEHNQDFLNDFLTNTFKGIKPADFHLLLSDKPWSKIYTTNIDDLIEKIFDATQIRYLVQNMSRKSTTRLDNKIEIIKLHGDVNNPSAGFVFSSNEYADSIVKQRDYRFDTLMVDFYTNDFIIIGSQFDETNFDYLLRVYEFSGYSSMKGKIFFINPFPSIIFKSKVKKLGGYVLEWRTNEFLEFVEKCSTIKTRKINANESSLRTIESWGFLSVDRIIRNHSESLSSGSSSEDSKLYQGFEPTWKDILNEWDFRLDKAIKGLDLFLNTIINNKTNGIFALWGKAYVGKTTILMRISIELSRKGFSVFYFDGKLFNPYKLSQYIKNEIDNNLIALIVDNGSQYYTSIRQFLNLIPVGKTVLVVTGSRPVLHFKKRYGISTENLFEFEIEPGIDSEFASEIVLRLDSKGYLGELKKFPTTEKRIREVMINNDLMSTLHSLTFGKGFADRLRNDLRPRLKEDGNAKELLLALGIFDKLDLPFFPKELLQILYGRESKSILDSVEDFIKLTKTRDIRLRTKFILNEIIKSAGPNIVLGIMSQIMIGISSLVENFGHSYWNEIHQALIKEKRLSKLLGLSIGEIKSYLYNLHGYYSENHNYWLHLGKAEQRVEDFDKAMNHFLQADALAPNSFMVRNAIARNYLKKAYSQKSLSASLPYFEEGEKIFLKLLDDKSRAMAHGYSTHAYIYEKIRYYKKFHVEISQKEMKKMHEIIQRAITRDPNDIMSKHINNYFIQFIKSIGKSSSLKFNLYDLARYKELFDTHQGGEFDFDGLYDD